MTTRKPAAPAMITVERPKSRRGRPSVEKPAMKALVANWSKFKVNQTIVLPDTAGKSDHASVTLDRYHFRKYAEELGLTPGVDYTIEASDQHGAIITRKK